MNFSIPVCTNFRPPKIDGGFAMPDKNIQFVFSKELALAIEEEKTFNEQQKHNAYAALCRYMIFGTEPQDVTLRMFCKAVKVSIEKEKENKARISKQNSANSNCRWHPKTQEDVKPAVSDPEPVESAPIEPEIVTPENKFLSMTDDSSIRAELENPDSAVSVFLETGARYDELSSVEREFVDRADVRSHCRWHKELQAAAKQVKRKVFSPPTMDEWLDFCREKNLDLGKMRNAYESYVVADWHDSQGNPIRNWKQKILQVWAAKPQNYNQQTAKFGAQSEMAKLQTGIKMAEVMLKKQGII